MPSILDAIRKFIGGHDNATHLKMSSSMNVDIVPSHKGALLQVSWDDPKRPEFSRNGGYSFSMDKQEYEKFNSLDQSSQKEFVESLINRHRNKKINEYNNGIYWYSPVKSNFDVYVYVTAAEHDKLNSLGEQERLQFFKELLKEREPEQYNHLINYEKALAAKKKTRNVAQTPWKRNGSPTNSIKNQGVAALQKNDIKAKWNELLDYARANATGKGRYREIYWLRDSFNEYLDMSDRTPGYGMGGQPGSQHNRNVLAGKIVLALGHGVGGTHELDEQQLSRLKESLNEIATPSRGMHR